MIKGEGFDSVVGARLVEPDDAEYLAVSAAHALHARQRFLHAAPQPHHIVAAAAERAVRTVLERLAGGSAPRILRADVIYRGRRAPEPFFLELDAVVPVPSGLAVVEIKTGRERLILEAFRQLERVERLARGDLGTLRLVACLTLPVENLVRRSDVGWPRVRLGGIVAPSLGPRSSLFVAVDDLVAQFQPHERAALGSVREEHELRRKAVELRESGDAAGAAALLDSLRAPRTPEGVLVADDDGIRVEGGDPARWVQRSLRRGDESSPSPSSEPRAQRK
ncbi:MAG: hypothetical protein RLZZ432_513 [Chloroflexota bacterium]